MGYRKLGAGRAAIWLGPALATALGLQGCGGTEGETGASPNAVTASRTFSCTQTTSGRGTYRQAVTGNLDASNVPHQVVVTRVQSGVVEISSANPTKVANYDGGYWKTTDGLDAWYLGSVTTGLPRRTTTSTCRPHRVRASRPCSRPISAPTGRRGTGSTGWPARPSEGAGSRSPPGRAGATGGGSRRPSSSAKCRPKRAQPAGVLDGSETGAVARPPKYAGPLQPLNGRAVRASM